MGFRLLIKESRFLRLLCWQARAMEKAQFTLHMLWIKPQQKSSVNFIGGYSALVHKGFSAGDYALISSIPQALAETDFVCSSVNIGSTKAGINMDAVAKMGKVVRKAAELTADRDCIGAAKLVVFL